MECLRDIVFRTGKGRRPSLPAVEVNNKLFLQLHLLKYEGNLSSTSIEGWFKKLCPQVSFPSDRVWKRIQRIVKCANSKAGDSDALRSFLSEKVHLDRITEELEAVGVTRALDSSMFKKCLVTNGMAIDAANFVLGEGLSYTNLVNLLKALSNSVIFISEDGLRYRLKCAQKRKGQLCRNSRKPLELKNWLDDSFFPLPSSESGLVGEVEPTTADLGADAKAPHAGPPSQTSISEWPLLARSLTKPSVAPAKESSPKAPSKEPSAAAPSKEPSVAPSKEASAVAPSKEPSAVAPSKKPSAVAPSKEPSAVAPSKEPSAVAPSKEPSAVAPSKKPSAVAPSKKPSAAAPSKEPSAVAPSKEPSAVSPSKTPSAAAPSKEPSAVAPSKKPSAAAPSKEPSAVAPSKKPSAVAPSKKPSAAAPSKEPSAVSPSKKPSAAAPSKEPSAVAPSKKPSAAAPSKEPSAVAPSKKPSAAAPSKVSRAKGTNSTVLSKVSLADAQSQIKKLGKTISCLRAEKRELLVKLCSLKKTKMYKNNTELRKESAALQGKVNAFKEDKSNFVEEIKNLKEEVETLKKDKTNLQKNFSKIKKKCENFKEQTEAFSYVINHIDNLNDKDLSNSMKLKDSRFNRFSDSVRITYMTLQGEANVSASNCSKVVCIVAKNLFGQCISVKDLPSTSSALTMMREGNHVAKCQVVDEIKKTDRFTFASDGTSRQKLHYMERHIVLNDRKALSLGFSNIASDDANSMLHQTQETLDGIVEAYGCDKGDEEKTTTFKECISKMDCLMSDRAANIKLFNKKMHEWRKDVLSDDNIETHFLYCNAHFSLGLLSAAEKALNEVEKHLVSEEGPLGRDKLPKFFNFNSSKESAALRAIRTSANVLGPRGG